MATATIRLEHPVDLRRTVFPLVRGEGDPTARVDGPTVWRAIRTPDGPATMRLTQTAPIEIEAEAWGPGMEHALAVARARACRRVRSIPVRSRRSRCSPR